MMTIGAHGLQQSVSSWRWSNCLKHIALAPAVVGAPEHMIALYLERGLVSAADAGVRLVMTTPMTVGQIADLIDGHLVGDGTAAVAGVEHQIQRLQPGDLFVARGPELTNAMLQQIIERGAVAICGQTRLVTPDVAQIVVPRPRAVEALIATAVHGYPSRDIDVVGVTGTDGKTTVTYLIESIVRASGRVGAVVGTLGVRVEGRSLRVRSGSPTASDFQRLLARLVSKGVDVVAVETTSQALAGNHLNGTHFAATAFTNLSHEHLDVHGDMENYFRVKSLLFQPGRSRHAVACTDSEWGRRLVAGGAIDVSVATTGPADLRAERVRVTAEGTRFELCGAGAPIDVLMPLPGLFNVANALVAAGCCLGLGIDIQDIATGIGAVTGPPGRFELVLSRDGRQVPRVYVDYAHTPAAVAAAIEAARTLTQGRVIVVVGAGGDRDRSKRADLGRAASAADVLIVTSDNPRREDPAEIAAHVLQGVDVSTSNTSCELDRSKAIHAAILDAAIDDVVLVLGKGHEKSQDRDGDKVPFSDLVEAQHALALWVADAAEVHR